MGSRRILTMGLGVLFVGCSSQPPPPAPKTVFDPLTQDLDRARAVQKTVDQNTEKSRQAVQAQENGDATP
jgi:hypothetical protein